MGKRQPAVRASHSQLPSCSSQGLGQLGNDCLVVILSFLVVSVRPDDYSKLRRWLCIQSVCKKLYRVCHSPQLVGLLNVRVNSLDAVQKLSQMPGVRHLSCCISSHHGNKWHELLPKFQSLQELNLPCEIDESVIKHVALCTTLKSLKFSTWGISGKYFQRCSTLTALERLQLCFNATDDNLKTAALFTNLHDLDISCCLHVSDESLKLLSHLRLQRLNLPRSSISDVGFRALNLQSLKKLEMEASLITAASFSCLGSCLSSLSLPPRLKAPLATLTSLTELVLLRCATDEVQDLPKLTNLRRLKLNGDYFDLQALSCLLKLQSLDVSGNIMSHVTSLSRLTRLESLKLRYWHFCDAPFDELSVLTGLKELDLSGSFAITDADLLNISCLKSLRSLDVSQCSRLTDLNLCWMEQLPQLEVLRFAQTGISRANAMERLSKVDWI